MNKKKVYTAPVAEVILLAPCEGIAAWDWKFENSWKNGYFPRSEKQLYSAVGIINGGGVEGNPLFTEDGFTIVKRDS